MKRRLLPLLLSLSLLCPLLPAALAEEEATPVTALCVADSGSFAHLDDSEFQRLCLQATGHELGNVTFENLLPARTGTLTYDGERVTAEQIFFPNSEPYLSQIRFTPHTYSASSRFTGRDEVAFTMTSKRDETVSGTLVLYVPEDPEGPLGDPAWEKTLHVDAGEPVSLTDPLPLTVFYKTNRTTVQGDVTSMTFALPSPSQGYLWLDYEYPSARKVLPGEVLYTDQEPNCYSVTFVPSTKKGGKVQLDFFASCEKRSDIYCSLTLDLIGKREPIPVKPATPVLEPEPILLSTKRTPLDLSAALAQACAPLEVDVKNVGFDTLPLKGAGVILSGETPVVPGETYPLEGLTFVPGDAFEESFTLRYVAADDADTSFSGTLTLSPGYPSGLQFQDLEGWEWAMPAAQFLAEMACLLYRAFS